MNHIVVIFQATQQETESLALAFGLGAVQAGADIRLRHLDPFPAAALAHAGYGSLRIEDLRWAQGIAIFLESESLTGEGELRSVFSGIGRDSANADKAIFLFHRDRNAYSVRLVESMAKQTGFERFVDLLDETPTAEHMTEVARSLIESQAKRM